MTDQYGRTFTTTTGTFGRYRIDGVEVGQAVTISVRSGRLEFPTRVVSVDGKLADVDFTANIVH